MDREFVQVKVWENVLKGDVMQEEQLEAMLNVNKEEKRNSTP